MKKYQKSIKSLVEKFFLFCVIFLLSSSQFLFAQNWDWTLREGGQNSESANATAFDSKGNVYVIGAFEGEITLNDKKMKLKSKGGKDIFLAKYDTKGKLVWAKRAGGTGSDIGYGVAINSKDEVCITGHFSLEADFDYQSLTNETDFTSVFVAKYSSEGDIRWAREIELTTIQKQGSEGRGIACDENNNIFVTGAIYIKRNTENVFLETDGLDMFIVKCFDSGGFWNEMKHMGGNLANDTGYGITVDKNNVYFTGIYKGKVKLFGKEMGTNSSSTNGFLAAFDTTLNAKWIKDFGGQSEYNHAWAVDTDSKGNIYMAGRIEAGSTLDGTAIYTVGKSDILLTKYDKEGNLLWFRLAGGAGWDVAHALTITEKDEIYIAGIFEGKASFGSKTFYSNGGWDAFVALYDTEGNAKEAYQVGASENEAFYGLNSSKEGKLALVGRSESYSLSINGKTLSTKGNSDALIFAMTNSKNTTTTSDTKNTTTNLDDDEIKNFTPLIYPNPTNGKLTIRFEEPIKENLTLRIYDRIGKFVEEYKINITETDVSKNEISLSLSYLPQGVYLLKINTDKQEYTHKISIEK